MSKISKYFNIPIETLIEEDLSTKQYSPGDMQNMAKDLEMGYKTPQQIEVVVGEENMKKIIKLLELRVNELELALKRVNPEEAKKLKIE